MTKNRPQNDSRFFGSALYLESMLTKHRRACCFSAPGEGASGFRMDDFAAIHRDGGRANGKGVR
jgi:hypothetical protein